MKQELERRQLSNKIFKKEASVKCQKQVAATNFRTFWWLLKFLVKIIVLTFLCIYWENGQRDTYKFCGNRIARFLKYAWPCFNFKYERVNPLNTNSTKWSNTLKQFGNSRRIVWLWLTILWRWRVNRLRFSQFWILGFQYYLEEESLEPVTRRCSVKKGL